jgi:hypothetical protein
MSANAVRVTRCKSWSEFLDKIRAPYFAGNRIFRGHADPKWTLSSVWQRISPATDWQGYVDRFKRHAIGLQGFDSSKLRTEHDWWALARHHGVVTPLLDWKRSPFVAAFFAFMGYLTKCNPGFEAGMTGQGFMIDPGSVTVWELFFENWPRDGQEGSTVARPGEFAIIDPISDFVYRQKAQRGLFTCLTHDAYSDIESYFASRRIACLLGRYELPASDCDTAFGDLTDMNMTYATLYPDLEGAAIQSNIWPAYMALFPPPGSGSPWPTE